MAQAMRLRFVERDGDAGRQLLRDVEARGGVFGQRSLLA